MSKRSDALIARHKAAVAVLYGQEAANKLIIVYSWPFFLVGSSTLISAEPTCFNYRRMRQFTEQLEQKAATASRSDA